MGVRMKALALVACAFFAAVVSVEAAVEEDGRAGDGILYSLDSSAGIAAEGDEGGVATLQEPMDLLQLQTDAKEGALFKTQGRTPATPVNEGWSWAHYTLFDPVKDAKRASHMRVNCIRICNSNRCVGKDNKGKTCLLNPTVEKRPAICEESTPGNGKVCQLNDGKTACKSSDGCRFTAARQAQVGGKRCAKPDRGCKFVPKPVNPDTAIKVTEKEKKKEMKRRALIRKKRIAKEKASKKAIMDAEKNKTKTNTNTTAGNSSHPEYKFGYKAALKARNKTSVDGTSSKRAKKADNGTVSNADPAKTGGSSSSAAAQAGSSAAPTTGKTTGKIAAADKAAEKADKRAKKKAAADKKKAEKAKAEAEAAKAKELDSKASAEKAKKAKEAAKEKDTKAKSVEEQAAKAKASAEKKTKAAKSAAAKAQAEKDEKEKNGKEADSKEKQKAAEIKKKAAEQKRIQEKNKEIADKKAAADAKAKAKEAKEKKEASAKPSPPTPPSPSDGRRRKSDDRRRKSDDRRRKSDDRRRRSDDRRRKSDDRRRKSDDRRRKSPPPPPATTAAPTAAPTAVPTAVPTTAPTTAVPTTAVGTSCAREHGTCRCNGVVTYGANGKWRKKTASGSIGCNNGVFGDPIGGVVKSCYCSGTTPTTESDDRRRRRDDRRRRRGERAARAASAVELEDVEETVQDISTARRLLAFRAAMAKKLSPEERDARLNCNCSLYRHDPQLTPKPKPAKCEGVMANGSPCRLNNRTKYTPAVPAACNKKDPQQTEACELKDDSSGCVNSEHCIFVKGKLEIAAARENTRCAFDNTTRLKDPNCKFTPKEEIKRAPARCVGTTRSGKSCKLHPGSKATCGPGKDAENRTCAVDFNGQACKFPTGSCRFVPQIAPNSRCASLDRGCRYIPATPFGLSHPTNGASCVGTDGDGNICKLNTARLASCTGRDDKGKPCRLNLDKTACEQTSKTCKFIKSRLAATKCAVQTGTCKFTHGGAPDLSPPPGKLEGEGQQPYCNFKHHRRSRRNKDGSKGLPWGIQANTTGKHFLPTDVFVDSDKSDFGGNWSYVDFGPSMNNKAGKAMKNGLSIYNSDKNKTMLSKRFFMHEFKGKFLLEAGAKYRFSVRGRDGAKLWLGPSPTGGVNAKGSYISQKKGCSETACASDVCTKAEFDETQSAEITGDGYWRPIRIQLAKANKNNIAKLFLRITKNGQSLTRRMMNIRTGYAKCDGAKGPDRSCRKQCAYIRDHPTAWGKHPANFVDKEKQGKPIQGCRFYEKPCCQGDFTQFGPDQNKAQTNMKTTVGSVVCTKDFASWMFQGRRQRGTSIMLDGDKKKSGMSCLKKSKWGRQVLDWDGKVKSIRVCEWDKEKPGGKAHRRRRGVLNCAGGAPEYDGWRPTHFPGTGKVCNFGGGPARHDKRLVPVDAVRLKNITGTHFNTTDGPPSKRPLTATANKYVSFDAELVKYQKEEGYMQQFDGQIFLKRGRKYKFALRSNAGSAVWLEGFGRNSVNNPVVQWRGCHTVGAMSEFDKHESVPVKGDGKWHKIIVYYAHFNSLDPSHLFLRVKEDHTYLTGEQLNIRHQAA